MKDLLGTYDDPDILNIAHIANFRVISDLVVDWESSVESLKKIHPAIVPKDEFSPKKRLRPNSS